MLVKFKYKGNANVSSGILQVHHWGRTGMEHVDIERGSEAIFFLHPTDIDLLYRMDSDSMSRPKDVPTSAYEWEYYTEDCMTSGAGDWTQEANYIRVAAGTGHYVKNPDGTYTEDPDVHGNYDKTLYDVWHYTPGKGDHIFTAAGNEAPTAWYDPDPDARLIKVINMDSTGVATFNTDTDTFSEFLSVSRSRDIRKGTQCFLDSGEGYEWTGSSWAPLPGGAPGTVSFQYDLLPDPANPEFKNKVIQYIGPTAEGMREDTGALDPDIGIDIYRGDWIRSHKVTDPDTGDSSWHWEILMRPGQIIEVETLLESNWKLRGKDEGYRVLLVKDWTGSVRTGEDPRFYARGWYQVAKDENKSTATVPYYYWKPIRAELVPVLGTGWNGFVDIKTEERECHIVANLEFEDLTADYTFTLLTKLPIPKDEYYDDVRIWTQDPFMASPLIARLTDNGTKFNYGDSIYVPAGSTAPEHPEHGVNWSRTSTTDFPTKITFKKDEAVVNQDKFIGIFSKNTPQYGELIMPENTLQVSSIKIDITYEFVDTDLIV